MASTLRLLLASQSPRRSNLLTQMGFSFEIEPADIDETAHSEERAERYVRRLAQTKAQARWREGYLSLGADTIVVLDNELLGKPRDEAHCTEMLQRLSGRTHEVATGIALCDGNQTKSEVVVSRVVMRPIEMQEAVAYWQTGEPQDKAGAYALQGLGGVFVTRIEGSFSGVIGLPMAETYQLLREAGLGTHLEHQVG